MLEQAVCPNCQWVLPTRDADVGGELWRGSDTVGVLGQPFARLAANGSVVVACFLDDEGNPRRCTVVAFAAATGQELWHVKLATRRICHQPVLVGQTLLIGQENLETFGAAESELVAYDCETGEQLWRVVIPAHSHSVPAVLDETVFITTIDQRGMGLRLSDGETVWETGISAAWSPMAAAVDEHGFYPATRSGELIRVSASGRVTSLYSADSTKGWFSQSPVVADGVLYATGSNGEVFAVDVAARRLRWAVKPERGATSPVAVGERYVYVGIKRPRRQGYALAALEKKSGRIVHMHLSEKHFYAPPHVHEGRVFVAGRDGFLRALDGESLEEQWRVSAELDFQDRPERFLCEPAIAGDAVVVGDRAGRLLAVTWREVDPLAELPPLDQLIAAHRWEDAGLLSALNGEILNAAHYFGKAETWYRAAQLYAHEGAWERAGAMYMAAERFDDAAEVYRRGRKHEEQANALYRAGKLVEAAQIYARLNLHQKSAEAWLHAGDKLKAANQYELANDVPNAIKLYSELSRVDLAAGVYERHHDPDMAVKLWQSISRHDEAAAVLERANRYRDGAKLLEEQAMIQEAAAMLSAHNDWKGEAELYRRALLWHDAAKIYEKHADLASAIPLYVENGDHRYAADLCVQIEDYEQAIQLYDEMEDAAQLAAIYVKKEAWSDAARAYMQVHPTPYRQAALCFEKANEFEDAARNFEKIEDWDAAIRCWGKSDTPQMAARLLHEKKGDSLTAAKLLEKLNDWVGAAELYERLPKERARSARLYVRGGDTTRALAMLQAYQEWELLHHWARQSEQFELAALACFNQADSEIKPSMRSRWYRRGGNAWKQAAQKAAIEQLDDSHVAELWDKAMLCYREAGRPKETKECQAHLIQLRRLPLLIFHARTEGELIEGSENYLYVSAENTGYGEAFYLSFKVHDTEKFVGRNVNVTRMFGSLDPGESSREERLAVIPQSGVRGENVTLILHVSYSTEHGGDEKIEQVELPVHVVGATERQNHAPITYHIQAEKFVQGDDKSQGDIGMIKHANPKVANNPYGE